ncbi:MAG TPA: hypothetical protein VF179_13700 [Thermoanaerobaculia bacterium]|nr:hypothetical protein [Thermoanaerobaculia bacterium]
MNETRGPVGILDAIASAHGTPEELPALLEIARRNGPAWRELGLQGRLPEEERAAMGRLQARLRHLLAEAQRSIEEILVQVDRRQELEKPAGPAAVLPDQRASGTGAYLATSATLRREAGMEPQVSGEPREVRGPDRYAAAVRAAIDGQQSRIGQLTAQIVEIQRGLSAL